MIREYQVPQNSEVELALLAAVVYDRDAMIEASPLVQPEDFYFDENQIVFRNVKSLYDDHVRYTLPVIAEHMERTGDLARIGGEDRLSQIASRYVHSKSVSEHAHIVRELSSKRRLTLALEEALEECRDRGTSVAEVLANAEGKIFAVGQAEAAGTTKPLAEYGDLAMQRLRRRRDGEVQGVSTGYFEFDGMTDGLPDSGLILLAARPSIGKTAIALNIAEHVAMNASIGVLFVSLEMGGQELAERILVSRARVNGNIVRAGLELGDRDHQRLTASLQELHRSGRFWVDDSPGRTATQIAANARRHRAKHGIGLVVIDYVQLIDAAKDDARKSRQEQVAAISRRLKLLAKELAIPVLALSQLNRMSESREDKKPRMGELRESGALEQDADMVLLLHRPEFYNADDKPGEAELIIAKNRNGPTGTVKLSFVKHLARFENHATAAQMRGDQF